jgi:hypothetical protein
MYKIQFSDSEVSDIYFVGNRYCWSDALQKVISKYGNEIEKGDEFLGNGVECNMPEHVAWELQEAFNQDTEGGHSMFLMLDHKSGLAGKLIQFYERVV